VLRGHAIVGADAAALGVKDVLGHNLLVGFLGETLAAERHVHFGPTDHFLGRTAASTEGKVSVGGTDLAYGGEFFYLFTQRNELQNIIPAFFLICAVKSGHDHNFARVCGFLGKFDNL